MNRTCEFDVNVLHWPSLGTSLSLVISKSSRDMIWNDSIELEYLNMSN